MLAPLSQLLEEHLLRRMQHSLYPTTLNVARQEEGVCFLKCTPNKAGEGVLGMCGILREDRHIEKGRCVFYRYDFNHAVNIGSEGFTCYLASRAPFRLKQLTLGWCFLCWVVNTDTDFTKFSCRVPFLLACTLFSSFSWRPY